MRNDERTDARSALRALLVGADERNDAKRAQDDLLTVIFADDADDNRPPPLLLLRLRGAAE